MNRLNAQLEFLNRIESLPIALEDIGSTRYVKSYLLEINETQYPLLQDRLEKIGKELSSKILRKREKVFCFSHYLSRPDRTSGKHSR